jgi:ankyrin repeat protein
MAALAYAQTTDFFELAKTGTPQQVQAAINKGANVNAQDNRGWTALMFAAANNPDPEVISTLLEADADAKARSNEGKTAFDYAQDNDKLKGTDALKQLEAASENAAQVASANEQDRATIELAAKDATVVGNARYESGGNADDIGYWTDTASVISWTFDVKDAGEYNVAVAIGNEPKCAGAMVNVTVGDKVLSFKVVYSGGLFVWKTLEIGKANLVAGSNAVKLQATSITDDYVANLHSVTLSKLEKDASRTSAEESTSTSQNTIQSYKSNAQSGAYTQWSESWKLPIPGKGVLLFKANATNDIHVAISPLPQMTDPMYEIVLGGWGNTRSVIRKKSQGSDLAAQNKGFPFSGQLAPYWVIVDVDQHLVSAGYGTEPGQNIIVNYNDEQFLKNAQYFSFSSWDHPIQIAEIEVRKRAERKPVEEASGQTPAQSAVATQAVIQREFDFYQDFFMLAGRGSVEQVQAAIDGGANVNSVDSDGKTPLMWAARWNRNPEVIATLLAAGARVNDRDQEGRSPLWYATSNANSAEIITSLLKSGARVDDRGTGEVSVFIGPHTYCTPESDMTPLMRTASLTDNPATISILVAAGATVDARTTDGGWTALMVAAENNSEVVTALLKAGANTEERDNTGMTPLMWAAGGYDCATDKTLFWQPAIIETLLKAGAKMDEVTNDGMTSLMLAAKYGKAKMMVSLLEAGADARLKSNEGKTALAYAESEDFRGLEEEQNRWADALARLRKCTFGTTYYVPHYQDLLRLIQRAKTGTSEEVQTVLANGAQVNDKDENGMTPLMYAAECNPDVEVIATLLAAGARVNDRDQEGRSPLWYATSNANSAEIITSLLKSGARVDDRGTGEVELPPISYKLDMTPLMRAAVLTDNPATISILVAAGAKVEDRTGEDSWTVLMLAAGSNHNSEVITALLKAGAKVEDRDKDGETPLLFAADDNTNPEVCTTLLNAGAIVDDRDGQGRTALMQAAGWNSNPEVTIALLKAGAGVNNKDSDGDSPLLLAAQFNQKHYDRERGEEVIAALVMAGAKVNERDHDDKTPLMYAEAQPGMKTVLEACAKGPSYLASFDYLVKVAQTGSPGLVRAEIAQGAKIDERDKNGMTLLMHAAAYNNENPGVLEVLLKAGARVDDRDNEGLTPLMWQARRNYHSEYDEGFEANASDAIEILLRAGAQVEDRDQKGMTALMHAAQSNRGMDAIASLLAADAKVEDRNDEGMTPLMLAAKYGDSGGSIANLVRAGARVDEQDNDGMTPLMLAAKYNDSINVIKGLLWAGAKPKNWTKVSSKIRSPLVLAAMGADNSEAITKLLKAGARVGSRDKDGMTPLMWAAMCNPNPTVILTLLRAGAKLKDEDKDGTDVLALAAAYNHNPEVIATLLKAGAQVNTRDKDGWTALIYAAQSNTNPDVAIALLKGGAKINEASEWCGLPCMTPLMYATWYNPNPQVILTLLKAGADGKQKYNDRTAFDWVTYSSDILEGSEAYKALQQASGEDAPLQVITLTGTASGHVGGP